jgi:hypothetical protein
MVFAGAPPEEEASGRFRNGCSGNALKDKEKNIEALLRLASENRKRVKNYKFSREECYERTTASP